MKNLSTSIYTFEKLRQENCVYVDKTEYLHKLVTGASQQVFCARPRRFGKSLTVSTLEAIFRGKRELFEGLYIGGQDYDWQEYPVVHLDFARADMRDLDKLQMSLCLQLSQIGEEYGISLQGNNPVVMLDTLLLKLAQQSNHGVVLLVDEYDKPIFEHIEDKEDAEEFRKFLSSFYQIIKGAESQERFVFLTGVTRLAKLSIFSKLNNLFDITMDEEFATMMGYTQSELENDFAGWLDKSLAEQVTDEFGELLDREGLLGELKRWYDGYCFAPGCETVYNPVSVGNFFLKKNAFRNYWFATGTPRFLVDLMQRNKMTLMDVTGARLPASSLDSFDVTELAGSEVRNERIIELMLQTGYLTLDYVLTRPQLAYVMRFPNAETEKSFGENLLNAYVKQRTPAAWSVDIWEAAESGDTEKFINMLQSDNLISGFFLNKSCPFPMNRICSKEITEYVFLVGIFFAAFQLVPIWPCKQGSRITNDRHISSCELLNYLCACNLPDRNVLYPVKIRFCFFNLFLRNRRNTEAWGISDFYRILRYKIHCIEIHFKVCRIPYLIAAQNKCPVSISCFFELCSVCKFWCKATKGFFEFHKLTISFSRTPADLTIKKLCGHLSFQQFKLHFHKRHIKNPV